MSNDSASIFYQHKYGRRFPVSLMALEMYAVEVDGAESDNDVYDALVKVLTKACQVKEPSKEDGDYLISRITSIGKELADKAPKVPEGASKSKSFGSSYMEYLHDLSVDSSVLKMVSYDMTAATKLYCEIDRDDVLKLVAEYFSGKAEENLVKMEASMYGNGGKYKNDRGAVSGPGKTHDISTPEGFANLKAMGF